MKTQNSIAVASLLAVAGVASAQLTAYNNRAEWEADLAALGLAPVTETFDGIESGDLNPGDTVNFFATGMSITVEGLTIDPSRASVSGGQWSGGIFPDTGHGAYVHTFRSPVLAFGQDYVGAASGLGIQLESTEGVIDIFDDGGYSGFSDGFFGFIATNPVREVRIIGSDADGGTSIGELYDADNASFAFEGVFSSSGSDAASIQASVDAFRAVLGDLNRPEPGSRGTGRREINWDGVPDTLATPNAFPGDFFNAPAFPRARGAEFSTPGTELQVSATLASGVPIEFENLQPGGELAFAAFSPERLFAPLGSTVTIVDFFVPGTDAPAASRGFGAIFTDVDNAGVASIELFDVAGESLGVWDVPAAGRGDETFSFLGIAFDEAIIARVEIISGDTPIDSDISGDFVVMDDFIYGEPVTLCPTDCDGSGTLDIFDFLCFQNAFDAGDLAADCDGSGELDWFDFLCFQNQFDLGCIRSSRR